MKPITAPAAIGPRALLLLILATPAAAATPGLQWVSATEL